MEQLNKTDVDFIKKNTLKKSKEVELLVSDQILNPKKRLPTVY
jgi:hypothetical protein